MTHLFLRSLAYNSRVSLVVVLFTLKLLRLVSANEGHIHSGKVPLAATANSTARMNDGQILQWLMCTL